MGLGPSGRLPLRGTRVTRFPAVLRARTRPCEASRRSSEFGAEVVGFDLDCGLLAVDAAGVGPCFDDVGE